MKNKEGMSAVVTTLMIILLVFIAVGIIWVVVNSLLQKGVGQLDISQKCLEVSVTPTALVNTGGTSYNVTLTRTASGEEIGGVKLVFFNDATNSDVIDFGAIVEPLGTKTRTVDAGIENVDKIELTVYFLDASGKEQLCTTTSSHNF